MNVRVPAARSRRLPRVLAFSPAVVVAALTLAALAVRLYRLGGSVVLRWDEGWSLAHASLPWPQLWRIATEEWHPPLYVALLKLWLVFGRSAAAIRLFSVACGVVAVPLSYLVGRRWSGRQRVGLLAAGLAAFWPLLIYYGQVARMYALSALLVLVVAWLILPGDRDERPPLWRDSALVLASVASLYTLYHTAWALAGLWLYVALRRPRQIPRLAVLGVLSLAGYVPWLWQARGTITGRVAPAGSPASWAGLWANARLAVQGLATLDGNARVFWAVAALLALGVIAGLVKRPSPLTPLPVGGEGNHMSQPSCTSPLLPRGEGSGVRGAPPSGDFRSMPHPLHEAPLPAGEGSGVRGAPPFGDFRSMPHPLHAAPLPAGEGRVRGASSFSSPLLELLLPALVLAISVVGVAYASETYWFAVRHLVPATPFVVLAVAWALDQLAARCRPLLPLALLALALACGPSTVRTVYAKNLEVTGAFDPAADFRYLSAHTTAHDRLFFNALARAGWYENLRRPQDPTWTYALRWDPIVEPMETIVARIGQEAQRYHRLWFVLYQGDYGPNAPLRAWLDAHLYPAGGEWQGEMLYVAYVAPASLANGERAAGDWAQASPAASWTGGIRLRSAAWTPAAAEGDAAAVELTWEAAQRPAGSYKVFVHVLDGQGRLVAQHDAVPGGKPTDTWSPGATVVDRHGLLLPVGARGTLHIRVGLYDAATGQRVLLNDGADSIELGTMVVD